MEDTKLIKYNPFQYMGYNPLEIEVTYKPKENREIHFIKFPSYKDGDYRNGISSDLNKNLESYLLSLNAFITGGGVYGSIYMNITFQDNQEVRIKVKRILPFGSSPEYEETNKSWVIFDSGFSNFYITPEGLLNPITVGSSIISYNGGYLLLGSRIASIKIFIQL